MLNTTQKVQLTVVPLAVDGTPGTIVNVPVWTISDATVATLTPATDGLTVELVALVVGTANVVVTANNGVADLAQTLAVIVTAAPAASLRIDVGTPTSK